MIPSPTLLFPLKVLFTFSTGKSVKSMTLSSILTDALVTNDNLSQFILLSSVTNFSKLMLPRLHTSPSCRNCSPHGLHASMLPKAGTGFVLFTLSMKMTPGSPFLQAADAISPMISLAVIDSSDTDSTVSQWSLTTLLGFISICFHSHIHGV